MTRVGTTVQGGEPIGHIWGDGCRSTDQVAVPRPALGVDDVLG